MESVSVEGVTEILWAEADGPGSAEGFAPSAVVVVRPDADLSAIYTHLRQESADSIMPAVLFVKSPGDGKVKTADRLREAVRQSPDVARRRVQVREIIERALGQNVSESDTFVVAGGDSIGAVQLAVDVEMSTGLQLPLLALFDLALGQVYDLVASQVYRPR